MSTLRGLAEYIYWHSTLKRVLRAGGNADEAVKRSRRTARRFYRRYGRYQ